MKNQKILATVSAGLISLGMMGSADAFLFSRLGGQAYYDDVLDITWLADANAAGTVMNWNTANAWAAGLNVAGVTGWRLPTMIDTGTSGCNFSYSGTDCGFNVQTGTAATTVYSEMASLWTDTLGNLPNYDTAGNGNQPGWGLTDTGPFSNVQANIYWSDLEYAPNTGNAWHFSAYDGNQNAHLKGLSFYGWAVHSGDVSAVPEPATAWLIGSGLLGLIGLARRKARI